MNGNVTVTQKDVDGVEITSKSYSVRKLREKSEGATSGYGSFLKAATLDVGKETELTDRTKVEDIQLKPVKVLTDEELFKACGGLTAHKGARHGLNLTGKLNRMEEQDRLLMERIKGQKAEVGIFKNSPEEWQTIKIKSRKVEKLTSLANSDSEEDEVKATLSLAEYSQNTQKRRQKSKKLATELSQHIEKAFSGLSSKPIMQPTPVAVSIVKNINEESRAIKKKKKKGKPNDFLTEQAIEMIRESGGGIESTDLASVKSSKKMKKKKKDKHTKPTREDFLRTKKPSVVAAPETAKKRKRERLQSASEASEDSDIDLVNLERNHLRHKRKLKRTEVFDTEFQKIQAEVAIEKGVFVEKKKKGGKKSKTHQHVNQFQKKLEKIQL